MRHSGNSSSIGNGSDTSLKSSIKRSTSPKQRTTTTTATATALSSSSSERVPSSSSSLMITIPTTNGVSFSSSSLSSSKKVTLWHVMLAMLLLSAVLIMIFSYQLVVVQSHHHHHQSQQFDPKQQYHGGNNGVYSSLEAYRRNDNPSSFSLFQQRQNSGSIQQQQQEQQQQQRDQQQQQPLPQQQSLPLALQSVLSRALHYQSHCQHVVEQEHEQQQQQQLPKKNVSRITNVDLPAFGIVSALQSYAESNNNNNNYEYQCQIPPETECQESQFTVIFMGYNPDRLLMMKQQIRSMLQYSEWQALVYEVVLVWNGPRLINESSVGQSLLEYQITHATKFRIFYPLLEGFTNDLMNRYHPRFQIDKTKAILLYDDDGPFYSYAAVRGGFELWKRHANAEIGAMARKINISPRQEQEKHGLLHGIGDRFFVSHCSPNMGGSDTVVYNYHFFAQFGANMALPSGSFFHSYYLCWIWHPAFHELRQFVKDHPVHPDDATVSMIISQLSGRAPKVYSRRINEEKKNTAVVLATTTSGGQQERMRRQRKQRRRLSRQEEDDSSTNQWNTTMSTTITSLYDDLEELGDELSSIEMDHYHHHGRKLLWEQQDWGKMRREAVNSLVSYFGSLNSGSIGWCYGTQWHVPKGANGGGGEEDSCIPDQANRGMLPWMQPDHTPKTTCP